MPIYEYQCNRCDKRVEFLQKFSEAPKRKCPECGALSLKRLVSAAAFHLKGDGWYVTDFRDKDKKKKADGESGADTSGKETPTKDAAKESSKETGKKNGDASAKSGSDSSAKSDSAPKSGSGTVSTDKPGKSS